MEEKENLNYAVLTGFSFPFKEANTLYDAGFRLVATVAGDGISEQNEYIWEKTHEPK